MSDNALRAPLNRLQRPALHAIVVVGLGAVAPSPARAQVDAPASPPEPAPAEPAPPAPAELRAPELLQRAEARYPDEAKAAGIAGIIVLRLSVDATGIVSDAEIVEGLDHGLDEAAREAALASRFKPAERAGQPVPSRILFRYEFVLPPAAPAEVGPPPVATPPAEVGPPPAAFGAPIGLAPPDAPVAVAPPTSEAVEVTVVGQQSEAERLQQSAEAVTVIDLRKAKQQTADLGEVLARAPGVSVRRSGGLGSEAIIGLNGLQGEQIALFVDGVPSEYSGYPGGIVNIPVNLVERIEIYRGVVPVRFGLDALGGAINIVTTRAGRPYLNASYQTGSYGVQRLNVTGRSQNDGFVVVGNAFVDLALNNFEMSDRQVAQPDLTSVERDVNRFNDAYRSYGGHLEAGVVGKPWAERLMVGGFASTFYKEIQTNAVMSVPFGEVSSSERHYGGNVQYEVPLLPQLSFELLLNYAHLEVDFRDVGQYRYSWTGQIARTIGTRTVERGEIDGDPTDRTEYRNLYLARAGLLATFSPEQMARIYTTPQYSSQRSDDEYAENPLENDLTNSSVSVVTGAEYELSLLQGRLSNVLLAKHYFFQPTSEIRTQPEGLEAFTFETTRTTHKYGVGDSLRYTFTPWLLAKASYEHAVRLPNADELFGDGRFTLPNVELVPETSDNFNLGPRLELSQTPIGDVVADINGFWRETKDQIVLIATAEFAPYRNVADVRTTGVEGTLWWQSPGQWLVLDGSFTWMESKNRSKDGPFSPFEGMRIPSRPYRFASWGARVHIPDLMRVEDSLELFYAGRYVNGFYRGWEIGNPRYKMSVPDQFAHSIGVTFSTVLLGHGRYSATIEVDNLLDSELYDVWGVQRPGRSFNFKVFAQL